MSDAIPAPAGSLGPLTRSVIGGAFRSIAVESGTTVHRLAYSEQAREGPAFLDEVLGTLAGCGRPRLDDFRAQKVIG